MATIGFFLVHLHIIWAFAPTKCEAKSPALIAMQCFGFRFDESETDFLRFAPSNSKHFKALRFQHEHAGRKCASISSIIKQVCGCMTDLQRLPPGPATCRF